MISNIKLKPLLYFVFGTLAVGFISSLFGSSVQDYGELIKPALSPPPVVFPLVWTILYALMGFSVYLIYESKAPNKKIALLFYFAQLVVNALWTFFFFGLNAYLFSFLWLVLLFVLVVITAYLFYQINKTAGLLFIPYILWLVFAGYLNWSIYILNK